MIISFLILNANAGVRMTHDICVSTSSAGAFGPGNCPLSIRDCTCSRVIPFELKGFRVAFVLLAEAVRSRVSGLWGLVGAGMNGFGHLGESG